MAVEQYQHQESKDTGSELVRRTRILGRKRVVVSTPWDPTHLSSPLSASLPKRRSTRSHMDRVNRLESLPRDILVRILCKVDHSDLKHLLLVSKFVNDATCVARETHFVYSTPSSKRVFSRGIDVGDSNSGDSEEAPGAPKQRRVARSRIDGKKLASVAVALFTSPEEQW